MSYFDIVFDGPPGPESGRFVEVEDATRASISVGEWIHRDDGYWVLRIRQRDAAYARLVEARGRLAKAYAVAGDEIVDVLRERWPEVLDAIDEILTLDIIALVTQEVERLRNG